MEVRHLIITGRVQGVAYRASMAREAEALGITGWVRNLSDGSVEAVIAGSAEQIATMVNWTRHGPPAAVVEHVAVEPGGGTFGRFEQRLSA